MSVVSFFTTMKGWSEVYPFYFWKLYSQPAGWAYSLDDLRIYARTNSNEPWERISNANRSTFNKDETLYFLRHIVPRIQEENSVEDHKKLKVFCEFLLPEYSQFKIVQESYNPLEILEDPTKYDTTTVVEVKR